MIFLCIEGKKKIIQKGDYFLWLASLHRRGVQVSSILEGGSETPTYFRNYSFIVVSLHWLVRCGVHQPYVVDTNPIKPRWRRVVGCAIIISLLNDWQKILIIFIELWNEKERGKISATKILVIRGRGKKENIFSIMKIIKFEKHLIVESKVVWELSFLSS